MTTLSIIANYEKKRLKCYGTVAAGEHVAVTVTDGAQWIGEGTALRLRVIFGPNIVSVFPFAEGDAWTAAGTQDADAACELNLNTVQAEKYLKHGGTCLWILDDVENHTLYATGEFDVLPWPKRRGIDEPIDLDGYPLLLDEINGLREDFEAYQQTVSQMLATKQNTIFDLAAIRSGAASGTTAVQPSQIARFVDGAEYKQSYGELNNPAILFKHGTDVIVALDATPFVKDGMVSTVEIRNNNLVITFNTDSGKQPIEVPLTNIFNPDNYYDKGAVDNLLDDKQDALTPQQLSNIDAVPDKASKSDVDPMLFAQYYPDGSVTSAAEFTAGIKYDAPDTTNRTITVKPFCNTGTAANDNSGLVGRVVIPPFVDEQGNGCISDDGTRYKVVGVSGSGAAGGNGHLTAFVAPNTVTNIGAGVFDFCSMLSTVSLPAATGVGDAAFSSCTSLDYVDFGDKSRPSVPTLGNDAFFFVPATCKIIVPYEQYDAWKAASGWSSLQQEFVRHSEKADKPATFTTGNLAKFDANGNPVDSGKKPSDFQSALTARQLANIAAVSDALAFDATHSYAAGDPVVYDGTLYTFTAAHTGAWTGSDVEAVNIIAMLASKVNRSGDTMTGPLTIDGNGPDGDNWLVIKRGAETGTVIHFNCFSYNGKIYAFPNAAGTLALLQNIAGNFSSSKAYAKGELVAYLGVLYRCIDPHTGPWLAADFTVATVEDVLTALRTAIAGKANASDLLAKLDSTSAAPAFSFDSSVSYAVGAHCTYNGKLYRCTTATTGGAWTGSANWTADTITDTLPYDRITITTGQLQDHAVQKVTLNAATTTLSLPALTDLTGKVSDFGIDVVNGYEVSGTPTAASFSLAGTIGTDYNLIVPEGEDWSEISALAAGEMAVYYFSLSAFQINNKPTWEVMKKVVTLVPVPSAP